MYRDSEVHIQRALKLVNVDLGCLNVMASPSLFLHFFCQLVQGHHPYIYTGFGGKHFYSLVIYNTVLKTESQPLFYSGNDAAGVVVEVGSGVSVFKPEDKVYTTKTISGAYAECSLVTADSLHLIPGSLSFAEAAALPTPYLTAFRGLIQ